MPRNRPLTAGPAFDRPITGPEERCKLQYPGRHDFAFHAIRTAPTLYGLADPTPGPYTEQAATPSLRAFRFDVRLPAWRIPELYLQQEIATVPLRCNLAEQAGQRDDDRAQSYYRKQRPSLGNPETGKVPGEDCADQQPAKQPDRHENQVVTETSAIVGAEAVPIET
jgi:hypothetical protein